MSTTPPYARFARVYAGRARRHLLAKCAVEGDFLKGALENGELLILQSRNEYIEDPACVHRGGLSQASHAGVGQGHHDTTCVAGGVSS